MRDCICEVIYVVISFYYDLSKSVYSFEKLSIYFDIIRFVCNLTTGSVFIGMAHITRINGHLEEKLTNIQYILHLIL